MGYTLTRSEFDQVLEGLSEKYRLYAPVLKKGQGRFTDTDVVIYDFVYSSSEIEFEKKSDYSFKEILTPLSQTLFFFTENVIKEADIETKRYTVFIGQTSTGKSVAAKLISIANDSDFMMLKDGDYVGFCKLLARYCIDFLILFLVYLTNIA